MVSVENILKLILHKGKIYRIDKLMTIEKLQIRYLITNI